MRTLDELFFRKTIGQSLMNSVKSDKLASSFLFWGREGSAKLYTALSLAYTIKKAAGDPYVEKGFEDLSHPDINIVIPAKKEITDDPVKYRQMIEDLSQNPILSPKLEGQPNIPVSSIRDLIKWLYTSPTYPGGRFAIVHEAHLMRSEGANAFLKTLEEPAAESHIILLSTEPESLLPTIRSRTQSVSFPPVAEEDIKRICIDDFQIPTDKIQAIVHSSGGSIKKAFSLKDETLKELTDIEETLWRAAMTGSLIDQLAWAKDMPNDRQLVENLLLAAQKTFRNAMLINSGKRFEPRPIENDIAENISGVDTHQKGIELFEDLLYENKRNPLWNLFWINLPLSLHNLFHL